MRIECPPIILVDDDAESRFLTERQLRRAEIQNPIVQFDDGAQVTEFLETNHGAAANGGATLPCLMLLDVRMPTMSGVEVLEWVRSQPNLRPLTVVMLSTWDDPVEMKTALRRGAHGYLIKQPAPETLRTLLDRAMALYRRAPAPITAAERAAFEGLLRCKLEGRRRLALQARTLLAEGFDLQLFLELAEQYVRLPETERSFALEKDIERGRTDDNCTLTITRLPSN